MYRALAHVLLEIQVNMVSKFSVIYTCSVIELRVMVSVWYKLIYMKTQ